MEKRYTLKLYDEPLIVFAAREDDVGQVHVEILDHADGRSAVMPLPFVQGLDGKHLQLWLDRRMIPKNRMNADHVLAQAYVSAGDTFAMIDACHAFSLSDAYWVAPEAFRGTWAEGNLFDNPFDDETALAAFSGLRRSRRRRLRPSPEWTTAGRYAKAWLRTPEGIRLYKAGSQGAANSGREPLCEYLASQVAQRMGLDAVVYDLDRWQDRVVTTCALLGDADTAFVDFEDATGLRRNPAALAVNEGLGMPELQAMRSMLVFDALVANCNRHASDFGYLRDNRSGKVIGFAPFLDLNVAFFPLDGKDDFARWPETAALAYPAESGLRFDEQLALIMGDVQREQLARLEGFHLSNHPDYPLPGTRLAALDSYLQKRLEALLAIPPVTDQHLCESLERSLHRADAPLIPLLEHVRTFGRADRGRAVAEC